MTDIRDIFYRVSKKAELNRYKDKVNVHDLPEIFHYWSNRYFCRS